MRKMSAAKWLVLVVAVLGLLQRAKAAESMDAAVELSSGWQMQTADKVTAGGAEISITGFDTTGWYKATVPGTALTTLVNNGVYPEPLYGENNRPERIPESLAYTNYWYRTSVTVPKEYAGKTIWLNFEGINYNATVFVNGKKAGTIRGAFIRGNFDVTQFVSAGGTLIVAVLVEPQPHPGVPHEHTLTAGMGLNGGESAIDGPTFLCTMGWDWIPAIRDRDTGIWRKVTLSATGPVVIKDPLVFTDMNLADMSSASATVELTLMNVTPHRFQGRLQGLVDGGSFEQDVSLAPFERKAVKFTPALSRALLLKNPRLWWPNGYGPQNMYKMHLELRSSGNHLVDATDVNFGVRKITYSVADSENLTISVNGVRVFIRGGDWGLDEAMKRIPRERLEAQIRMHAMANINMIRNWVGQSTNEDFYELCDKYGILLWDEFFQPNPSDGPNPADEATYLDNVRDKVLRFRNHPSIAVWCARNEGYPPKSIDDALRKIMAVLDPMRLYQPSSTDGHGVRSNGPYRWRTPREFYIVKDDYFKTETGSVSVPTIESVRHMLAPKDWEMITDAWAEHDLARGASGGDKYPGVLAARYGATKNLADFVQKAQLMNYEAYRAMYEGRNAQLFHPTTGILTWMSNPAQPSFVWQLYHYDLEPNASLFAVMHAAEMVHAQMNESTGEVQVINNQPTALHNASMRIAVYALDGKKISEREVEVNAAADAATGIGPVDADARTAVTFVKLELKDSGGKLLSQNFYWRGGSTSPDDLTSMETMPRATVDLTLSAKDGDGKRTLSVTLSNPTDHVALMTHVQLRRKQTQQRVLPVYYSDNYISLLPHESRMITIEAAVDDFKGEAPLLMVDGFNVDVTAGESGGVAVAPNTQAMPSTFPATGLPFQTAGLRQ